MNSQHQFKRVFLLLLIASGALLGNPLLASNTENTQANEPPNNTSQGVREKKEKPPRPFVERLKKQTPDVQREIVELFTLNKFLNLPQRKMDQIRETIVRIEAMSEEEKAELRKNLESYHKIRPKISNHPKLKKLPAKERRLIYFHLTKSKIEDKEAELERIQEMNEQELQTFMTELETLHRAYRKKHNHHSGPPKHHANRKTKSNATSNGDGLDETKNIRAPRMRGDMRIPMRSFLSSSPEQLKQIRQTMDSIEKLSDTEKTALTHTINGYRKNRTVLAKHIELDSFSIKDRVMVYYHVSSYINEKEKLAMELSRIQNMNPKAKKNFLANITRNFHRHYWQRNEKEKKANSVAGTTVQGQKQDE